MRGLGRFDIREKVGILAGIIVVVLGADAAFAFLVNLPRAEQASSLRSQVESFNERLAKRREKVAALRSDFDRVVGGDRSLHTFFDDVLSTKRQRMMAIQKEVRAIGQKFNIAAESISYSRQIFEKDRIVKFSAVLPLIGPYESLRAFISAVERSENFIIIESVALTDSKEGGVILSLNISLSTFFFDPDVVPRAGAEATRS